MSEGDPPPSGGRKELTSFIFYEILGVVGSEAAASWMIRIGNAGVENIVLLPAQIVFAGAVGVGAGAALYAIARIVGISKK